MGPYSRLCMNVAQSSEIAYLPNLENIEDDLNIQMLNDAYAFCIKHRVRSFVTYTSFIPFIQSKNYQVRLCAVIDFPNGTKRSEEKLFEAGRAYELCKKSSASEIDVVLNPIADSALDNICSFAFAKINNRIGVKYIFEISKNRMSDVIWILNHLNNDGGLNDSFKMIKTNTGKKENIPFEDKLEMCKQIRKVSKKQIKVSGGVKESEISTYKKELGENTVFGVSYEKALLWEAFKC